MFVTSLELFLCDRRSYEVSIAGNTNQQNAILVRRNPTNNFAEIVPQRYTAPMNSKIQNTLASTDSQKLLMGPLRLKSTVQRSYLLKSSDS